MTRTKIHSQSNKNQSSISLLKRVQSKNKSNLYRCFLLLTANPLRDNNDPQGVRQRRRHHGQPRGRADTPEKAGRPDEVEPVQRVGAERTRPRTALEHGPQLGRGHHRPGLYRATQGSIRQVRGPRRPDVGLVS